MAFTTFTQSKSTHRAGSLNPKLVQGELPLPVFTVDSDNGSLYFHDNGAGGQFIRISNVQVAYRPPNRTQIVTVSANDGHEVDLSLTVTGTFPIYPQKGYEVEEDIETKVKAARDGTEYFAEIGKEKIVWRIGADRRLLDEIKEMWDFLSFHRKYKKFWVYDTDRGLMNSVRRISPIPTKFEGANSWSGSCILQGDYNPAKIARSGYAVIKINSGGPADGEYAADYYYENGDLWSYEGLTIDATGLSPSPGMNVLKYGRYHPTAVEYKITGLIPSTSFVVKTYYVSLGSSRTMQLYFNGVARHSVSVGPGTAAVQDTDTRSSDSNGEMTIDIARVSGANAMINGISIEKA